MRSKANASKTLLLIGIIFFSFALLFVIVFGFIYVSEKNKIENADASVTGYISDFSSNYDSDGDKHTKAYITYEFNGEVYSNIPLNTYSSDMKIGKEYTVYIPDENKPHEIVIETSWVFILIMSIFGGVFGAIGIGFIIGAIKGNRSHLMDTGMCVYATVTFMGKTNTRINNKNTYRIEGEWTDSDGVVHKVKSPLLFYLPIHEFSEVRVYVDPNNYKKYYMDVEFEPSVNMESAF